MKKKNKKYDFGGESPVEQQQPAGGGDQQAQIMQIIQSFCQLTQKDPNEVVKKLQELAPEEQQKVVEEMISFVQENGQQQSGNPSEEQTEPVDSSQEEMVEGQSPQTNFGIGGVNMQQTLAGQLPNAEIEGKENVKLPSGVSFKVNGKSHAKGGIDIHLPENAFVFSDKLKPTKEFTQEFYSAIGKNLEKIKPKSYADLANIINTEKEFKELNSNDKYKKQSAEINIAKKSALQNGLALAQEKHKFGLNMENNYEKLLADQEQMQNQVKESIQNQTGEIPAADGEQSNLKFGGLPTFKKGVYYKGYSGENSYNPSFNSNLDMSFYNQLPTATQHAQSTNLYGNINSFNPAHTSWYNYYGYNKQGPLNASNFSKAHRDIFPDSSYITDDQYGEQMYQAPLKGTGIPVGTPGIDFTIENVLEYNKTKDKNAYLQKFGLTQDQYNNQVLPTFDPNNPNKYYVGRLGIGQQPNVTTTPPAEPGLPNSIGEKYVNLVTGEETPQPDGIQNLGPVTGYTTAGPNNSTQPPTTIQPNNNKKNEELKFDLQNLQNAQMLRGLAGLYDPMKIDQPVQNKQTYVSYAPNIDVASQVNNLRNTQMGEIHSQLAGLNLPDDAKAALLSNYTSSLDDKLNDSVGKVSSSNLQYINNLTQNSNDLNNASTTFENANNQEYMSKLSNINAAKDQHAFGQRQYLADFAGKLLENKANINNANYFKQVDLKSFDNDMLYLNTLYNQIKGLSPNSYEYKRIAETINMINGRLTGSSNTQQQK